MRIDCKSCGAAFTIDDKLITDRGIRAQCPKCGTQTVVKKDAAGADSPFGAPPGGNPFGPPAGPPPGGNPFAPPGGPPAGGNPFGPPSGPPPGNPFAPPGAAAGGNPFGPPAGPPAGGNPFGPPAGPPAGGNPFAPPGPPPAGGSNPFAPPGPPPAAKDPFGPPAGGNPFGAPGPGGPPPGPPAGGNPFGAPSPGGPPPGPGPFGAPAGGNPFGPPAETKNPFDSGGAPAGNPFGGPPAGGANPFGGEDKDPFAAGGADNPFGGSDAGDPFGPKGGGNPFDKPSEGAAGDPFASAAAASNPFAGPPAGPGGDPFAAGDATENPFGALGGDEKPPAPDPFAAARDKDPFAAIGGGGGGGGGEDDPFAGIGGTEPPPPAGGGGRSGGPSTSTWQVETRGGKSTDISLDELRAMIRTGQVGPNDQAGPMGKPMRKVVDDPILAVSLPKGTSNVRARSASSSSGGGGGLGRVLAILVVVVGIAGGAYGVFTLRPDLFEQQTDAGPNPFRRAMSQWSLQFPEVEGTSQEHVVEGRKYMRMDTAVTYRRADEHFRRALLLDVSNLDAVAGYVENYSYLPNVGARANPEELQLVFDGIEWALKAEPDNPRLLRASGALRVAVGEVDEASRLLNRAVRRGADDPETRLLLARAGLDRDINESLKLVDEVQRKAPDLKQALTVAGAAHRRVGNYSRARDFLQSRLEADPGNTSTLMELARLELDLGNAAAALRWLQRLIAAEERDVAARLMLAKTEYQFLGRNTEAERELRKIVDSYESSAGDLLLPVLAHYAYLRALRADPDGAAELAKRALELDPTYAPAQVVMGRALMGKADTLKDAKTHLEEAVRLLKGSATESSFEPVARVLLADVQVKLGDLPNAVRNYEEVIRFDPRYASAYFGLSAALVQQGRGRHAVGTLKDAMSIDPHYDDNRRTLTDYPAPSSDLLRYAKEMSGLKAAEVGAALKPAAEGVIRYYAGDRDTAVGLLNKALRSDGDNHMALLYLGVDDLEHDRAAAAAKKLRQAIKTTAGAHTLTHLYLAEAEIKLGSYAEAEKRLQRVLDDEGTLAQARYTMAELRLKQGQRDEAISQLKELVREFPLYRPPKSRLATLGG